MKETWILFIGVILSIFGCVDEERGTPGTGTYEVGTGQEPHHRVDTLPYDTLKQTPYVKEDMPETDE